MKYLNCSTDIQDGYDFCHNCGRPIKKSKLSNIEIIKDAIDATFNLNTKFFSTLFHIHDSTKLTQAFVQGKRILEF